MNITKQTKHNVDIINSDDSSATSPPLRWPAAKRGKQNQDQRVGGDTGHEGKYFQYEFFEIIGCESIPMSCNVRYVS